MIYYNYPKHYPPPPPVNMKYRQTNYKPNYPHSSYNKTNNLNNYPQKQLDSKNETKKEIPTKSNNESIFEIFGIKLSFDDILLICLIFFLYNEGVQDQYLFIVLVLLLLS